MNVTTPPTAEKDAGNGSHGISRVIDASRSPSPDSRRSAEMIRSMKQNTLIFLSAFLCIQEFVFAEDPQRVPTAKGSSDPRTGLTPVILFPNCKNRNAIMQEPLLVYSRWDVKPPNQILGIDAAFTDAQIIAGLRDFYLKWRAPENGSSRPRPQLILAAQNWGCGAGLHEQVEKLSLEFEIDVYTIYPVISGFGTDKSHPRANDKVLAEIIRHAEQAGTGQPATRPESKSDGGDKPQPESEGRSR